MNDLAILGLAGLLLAQPSDAPGGPTSSSTDWLKDARLGVFVHFLPASPADLAKVEEFDVEALARQLDDAGARYLVFTLGQNSGFFGAPNAAYDRKTGYVPGERCARRDLPLDLHHALERRGIRLMLYLPCQTPNEDARAQKAFGLPQGVRDQPIDARFAREWAEVIHEWSARYGDAVAGWWFDGGYAHVGFDEEIARIYAAAVRRGNPSAIVTFNPGVKLVRHTRAEDYTAGELDEPFSFVPSSRWVDGSQWHALTYLGSSWGRRDTRYPTEAWREWFGKVAAHEGVVTLDLGPSWDPSAGPIGGLAPAQVEQVRALAAISAAGPKPEPPRGIGRWDALAYGHHRAVVRVEAPADAVVAHVPWRRPDRTPEAKEIVVIDAATGARIANVARASVTREAGDLVFQPQTAPGDYYVNFLPFLMTGRSNYPTIEYPKPVDWADTEWLARNHLTREGLASGAWRDLPAARVVKIQSSDAFDAFTPMEVIASADETRALLEKHPGEAFLLFPEDRAHPIRMSGNLPKRWVDRGASTPLELEARPGEFVSLQVGLFAVDRDLQGVTVETGDVRAKDGRVLVPGSALHSFGTRGVDWTGRDLRRDLAVARGSVQALWLGVPVPAGAEPGDYEATVTVGARGLPAKAVRLGLRVAGPAPAAGGDDEPERLSRLRWLDSRLAQDDGLVPPYTPVVAQGRTLSALGRTIELDASGFPRSVRSRFTPEVTSAAGPPRELLAAAVTLVVEEADGPKTPWAHEGPVVTKQAEGAVEWQARSRAGALSATVRGRIEFDGTIEYQVALEASDALNLRDVRLELPLRPDSARYAMGLGWKGGTRPDRLEWTWDVAKRNQDAVWVGDVAGGVQLTLKDDRYERPLNTNFYLQKPLVLPASWGNGGKGTCRLGTEAGAYLVRCGSGPRRMEKGETQRYDFRLALTPFKPIDTDAQWRTRFYHRYAPLGEIQAAGANVVNVHHATPINPWINYPFLRPAEVKAYVDEAHARGMRVKIYYTVREISNRAPELWPLRSLGHEVLSAGPGGGWAWLQEHVGTDYIPGWFVPEIQDAALVTSGISRWHNFYVEGLDWLARNVGIDGLYLDDVAFDRTTMKRVRKVLDRRRPGALIDLHSANQYNPRDGFASSANLYLEHLPYVDRLWFGEYFDYDAPPDYWLVEISGVPFGLLGEMLEKGGNPWRGMLFGATSRLPWEGDPRPLWKAWDAFGLEGSQMKGWWVPDAPVRTVRPGVLATAYVKPGRALVAIASWEKEPVEVSLAIDGKALGIDLSRARLTAPAIEGFQPAASFAPNDRIRVEPGRGWLLVLDGR